MRAPKRAHRQREGRAAAAAATGVEALLPLLDSWRPCCHGPATSFRSALLPSTSLYQWHWRQQQGLTATITTTAHARWAHDASGGRGGGRRGGRARWFSRALGSPEALLLSLSLDCAPAVEMVVSRGAQDRRAGQRERERERDEERARNKLSFSSRRVRGHRPKEPGS